MNRTNPLSAIILTGLVLATNTFATEPDIVQKPAEEKTVASQNPPSSQTLEKTKIDPNQIVGKVSGQTIRLADVFEQAAKLPPQARNLTTEKLFPILLQQMATRTALVKKAREKGLDQTVRYKQAKAELEENLLQEVLLTEGLKPSMNEEEMKQAYEDYRKDFKPEEQVKVHHILVKEEQEAKDIIERLQKGEAFGSLAQEKSLDKTSAARGGELPYFGRKGALPELAKAAFDLRDGGLTGEPVKSVAGYHVIGRDGIRKTEPVPYDQAKTGVLPQRIRQKHALAKLKESIDPATIELFNMDGSKLEYVMPGTEKPGAGADADLTSAAQSPAVSSPASGVSETKPQEDAGRSGYLNKILDWGLKVLR